VKLVLDKIPALIAAEGRKPNVRLVRGTALTRALVEKLAEEHAEFVAARSAAHRIEELADIVEVATALAKSLGSNSAQFRRVIEKKRAARGGFAKGYLLLGEG
jgi:predicted house-cleaning noncanonical NTP pyrophosphatase (MazG superfamily)